MIRKREMKQDTEYLEESGIFNVYSKAGREIIERLQGRICILLAPG